MTMTMIVSSAEKLDRLNKVMRHPWVPAQHLPEEMESLLEQGQCYIQLSGVTAPTKK
jgi:hypothetical protein